MRKAAAAVVPHHQRQHEAMSAGEDDDVQMLRELLKSLARCDMTTANAKNQVLPKAVPLD